MELNLVNCLFVSLSDVRKLGAPVVSLASRFGILKTQLSSKDGSHGETGDVVFIICCIKGREFAEIRGKS